MDNLTADEIRSLRCVAGMMIPASSAFGVPGADDDMIIADIIASIGRDVEPLKQALARLDALAGAGPARQQAAAATFREQGGPTLAALIRAIVQCYYRDDRVMQSLGMEV